MAETFYKNDSDELLTIEDYEDAYDNGALKYLDYINTGLLSTVINQLYGLINIKKLDMPNVNYINGTLFGGAYVNYLSEIYAPKLKFLDINKVFPSLEYSATYYPNLSYLYLEDIEGISFSFSGYYFRGFDNLSNINYSKLISIQGDDIFPINRMSKLEYIYLPELTTIYAGFQHFSNNSNIKYISIPKLGSYSTYNNGYIYINSLTNLESININNLSRVGLSGNLNKLKSVTLSNWFGPDILIMTFNSGQYNNLSLVNLPDAKSISAYRLGLGYINNSETKLYLPKCKQFVFPSYNSRNYATNIKISEITLPAISILSAYNFGYTLGDGWRCSHTLKIPNVKIIYSASNEYDKILYNTAMTDIAGYEINIDAPLCEYIDSDLFVRNSSRWNIGFNTEYIIRYVHFKTQQLKNIGSNAFNGCFFLNEINIPLVSVLNEGVFRGVANYFPYMSHATYHSEDSTCTFILSVGDNFNLLGSTNVTEVKSFAFDGCVLSTSDFYLPNCTKFDFNQNYDAYFHSGNVQNMFYWFSYPSGTYTIESVTYSQISDFMKEFYTHSGVINNFKLPKLSELTYDINFIRSSYSQTSIWDLGLLYVKSNIELNNCSRIYIYDTRELENCLESNGKIYSNAFVCKKMYIPECTSISFSNNKSHILGIKANELYAPKLSYINNLALINCTSIVNDNVSSLYGSLSYIIFRDIANNVLDDIDIPYSTSANLSLYIQATTSETSTIINYMRFPKLTGEVSVNVYHSNVYGLSTHIASGAELTLGDTRKICIHGLWHNAKFDIGTTLISGDFSDYCINEYSKFTNYISDIDVYLNDLSYIDITHDNTYLSLPIAYDNASYVSPYVMPTPILNSYYYSRVSNWGYGIYHFGVYANKVYLPNLTSININWNASISVNPQSSSQAYLYSNIYARMLLRGSEIYAPNLSNININANFNEGFNFIRLQLRCATGLTSLTIGLSDINIFGVYSSQYYYALSSAFSMLKYLSMSNLISVSGPGLSYSQSAIRFTNLEELHMEKLKYIGSYAFSFGSKITNLTFEQLESIDTYGITAPYLNVLSLPKVKTLSRGALYLCTNLSYLELPVCSVIDDSAIPSKLTLLKLGYNGIVSIGSSYTLYSGQHIIQVPNNYYNQYKNNSKWQALLSKYSNLQLIAY